MTLSRTSHRSRLGVALLAGLAIPLGVACSDDDDDNGGGGPPGVHADVPLLDRLGNPIVAGSTEPYSPRQTCGGCHDVDAIANGYHFSQGRTDLNGTVVVTDDYFADGRNYVRSPGMYGKW
jgi:hypothetical protein